MGIIYTGGFATTMASEAPATSTTHTIAFSASTQTSTIAVTATTELTVVETPSVPTSTNEIIDDSPARSRESQVLQAITRSEILNRVLNLVGAL